MIACNGILPRYVYHELFVSAMLTLRRVRKSQNRNQSHSTTRVTFVLVSR